jgi:hypothetical protein
MLLIVNLSTKQITFPIGVLEQCDAVLAEAGFKKEVHSVVKPGEQLSATYSGPVVEKTRIERMLAPLAEKTKSISP